MKPQTHSRRHFSISMLFMATWFHKCFLAVNRWHMAGELKELKRAEKHFVSSVEWNAVKTKVRNVRNENYNIL